MSNENENTSPLVQAAVEAISKSSNFEVGASRMASGLIRQTQGTSSAPKVIAEESAEQINELRAPPGTLPVPAGPAGGGRGGSNYRGPTLDQMGAGGARRPRGPINRAGAITVDSRGSAAKAALKTAGRLATPLAAAYGAGEGYNFNPNAPTSRRLRDAAQQAAQYTVDLPRAGAALVGLGALGASKLGVSGAEDFAGQAFEWGERKGWIPNLEKIPPAAPPAAPAPNRRNIRGVQDRIDAGKRRDAENASLRAETERLRRLGINNDEYGRPITTQKPTQKPTGPMSDEQRYGKTGAEIIRIGGMEAYKNRPKDARGNLDYLNKLKSDQRAAQISAGMTARAQQTPLTVTEPKMMTPNLVDLQTLTPSVTPKKPGVGIFRSASTGEKTGLRKAIPNELAAIFSPRSRAEQKQKKYDLLQPVTVTGKRTTPRPAVGGPIEEQSDAKYAAMRNEEVEQIDEAFDQSSPSHAKVKELVSNYGNRSAMRAVYHGDGSATIHTTGDKKVSSATRVDHIHDQAGLGYNRPAAEYKNLSKSKGGLKFKTKETEGKSIYGSHEIHISHKGMKEEVEQIDEADTSDANYDMINRDALPVPSYRNIRGVQDRINADARKTKIQQATQRIKQEAQQRKLKLGVGTMTPILSTKPMPLPSAGGDPLAAMRAKIDALRNRMPLPKRPGLIGPAVMVRDPRNPGNQISWQEAQRRKQGGGMKEEVEQIDEAFDQSSPSHAKVKELVSNYGNRSAMRAVYHGDGSATIHTTGDKKVSSATRVDHIHDQAGLGYNRPAAEYKNLSKSKGGLKFKTKETEGKSIYGSHEIHISHKGMKKEPAKPGAQTGGSTMTLPPAGPGTMGESVSLNESAMLLEQYVNQYGPELVYEQLAEVIVEQHGPEFLYEQINEVLVEQYGEDGTAEIMIESIVEDFNQRELTNEEFAFIKEESDIFVSNMRTLSEDQLYEYFETLDEEQIVYAVQLSSLNEEYLVELKKFFKKAKKFLKKAAKVALPIAAGFLLPGIGGAIAGKLGSTALGTAVKGLGSKLVGKFAATGLGKAVGGLAGKVMSSGIGSKVAGALGNAARNALTQGAISKVTGGSFSQGAKAGAISGAAGSIGGEIGGRVAQATGSDRIGRVVSGALGSGISSKAMGGRFSAGAQYGGTSAVGDEIAGAIDDRVAAADERRRKEAAERLAAQNRTSTGTTQAMAAESVKLDPVGREDADVNNDGRKDKTDVYLARKREKIGNAIAKRLGK